MEALVGVLLRDTVQLTHVHLGATHLGDSGAELLADNLVRNHWLQALYLQSNGITDAGAQRLAEALKTNAALSELHMDGNSLSATGVSALAAAAAAWPLVTRPLASPAALAVCMGLHARLGAACSMRELPSKVVRLILKACSTQMNRKLRVSAAVAL